jgi:hypothetical protein
MNRRFVLDLGLVLALDPMAWIRTIKFKVPMHTRKRKEVFQGQPEG